MFSCDKPALRLQKRGGLSEKGIRNPLRLCLPDRHRVIKKGASREDTHRWKADCKGVSQSPRLWMHYFPGGKKDTKENVAGRGGKGFEGGVILVQ